MSPALCTIKCGKIHLWVFLKQEKKQKKMLEGLRYFLLHDYLHFKWWIMMFTTFRIYARFRILFVHIFVPLGFLLWKTREPTHNLWRRRKSLRTNNHVKQESPGFCQRNLRRCSEMRTSRKTKWYKNMHKKNSKSCITPESGEHHYSLLKM